MKIYSIFMALIALIALPLRAEGVDQPAQEDYVKSHYTKYEYRIPMRDGKRLFTSVYVPKDQSQKWPFMVDRTPYNVAPYGVDLYKKALGPSDLFEKGGYIFVYQDVRGRYMSEGDFLEMRPHIDDKKSSKDVDDASDMYDTMEFLLKHVPNNNGRAGIWGISYPGFYTSASIIDSHPSIKAASPQAPMTNLFMGDDGYHGGAFMLAANFGFYSGFKPLNEVGAPKPTIPFDMGMKDNYRFLLQAGATENLDLKVLKGENWLFHDQLNHTSWDEYWKVRNLAPHMKNVKSAVMVTGGWFDAEDLQGPFSTYKAIHDLNPGTPTTLVIGPWVHGGWVRTDGDHLGDISFNAKTSLYYREKIEFAFFEHYLKDKGNALPAAWMFETGSNEWKTFETWPPKAAAAKTLYFGAQGTLSFNPPTEAEGVDSYVSDPAHPVPFVGYTTDTVPQRYMADDQRFASQRTDVLTYQTEVLEEDVTIAGPIKPRLKIASTGTDADFVVKLIDVYPDNYPESGDNQAMGKRIVGAPPLYMAGYQMLVRGEPMRAKFRNSWEKPEPLTPGKVTEVDSEMPDIFHTFRKGHRIMVQVQSSWFPLVDRNPQTFVDIPHAKPTDFVKATQQVFHSAREASGVEVLVVPQP